MSFEVTTIDTEIKPGDRQTFGLCENNNIVYIFGGENDQPYDDLWQYDSKSHAYIFEQHYN